MARISRPPGYDMAYRPSEAVYGPPWLQRLPSLVYLGVAVLVTVLVLVAERSPPGSLLFEYFITADTHRVLSSRTLSLLLVGSAAAGIIRNSLRGIRIRGDGLESREVVNLFWPRVRRIKWAQIDMIRLDLHDGIGLDLWDGTRADLPRVRDRDGLQTELERVAAARAIPIRGGKGLYDLPEEDEYADEDAESGGRGSAP